MPELLILGRGDVERLLDLDVLLEALRDVHIRLSSGGTSMPPRIAAHVPELDGFLAAMPAHVPGVGLGAKLVTVFPHNTGVPSHNAVVALFDPATGAPTAVMDGGYITAVRTAAAAALAMTTLARPEARTLAILGTGVQARSHHRLFTHVRGWDEVRIAGRDHAKASELAAELGAVAAGSWEEAVRGADVVAATTHPVDPVVCREWLAPGTHVSSVGFNAGHWEIDRDTVAGAKVVVELRAAALAPPPAGATELQGLDDAAELGEVLAGTRPGREDGDEITLYKSVGIAAQDLAAAAVVIAARGARA
jgi:alanine dehydrogenase